MKRILSFLAIMMMAVAVKAVVNVSTAQALKNAVANNSEINLTQDIDVSSMSAISSGNAKGYLFSTFTGKIHGNGYTLRSSTHPLFYALSGATIEDLVLDGFKVTDATSVIARTSGSSTFSHITVKNSSITYTGNSINNFGMIVGWSNNDNIIYCNVESDCSVTTNRRQTGGIAGEAFNGVIIYCRNSGTVSGDADYIGGIVGYAGDASTGSASTIAYCLNTGTIYGDGECGGIAGHYCSGTISHCVNTGTISSKDGGTHENVGGIAGKLNAATCEYSINFGSVAKAKSQNAQFAIYGGKEGTVTLTSNEYYCYVYGGHFNSGIQYIDLLSGKYAHSKGWLYQDIENGTYITKYPVPISEAGAVNSNILCDGTESYSNKYDSSRAHACKLDADETCTVCGAWIKHIADADALVSFASDVNEGKKFGCIRACLDNDIDLSGKDFPIIGRFSTHPFEGIFDGQGHRIKNMTLNLNEGGIGLFGVVAGTSTVKNVIIDSSCSVTSTSDIGVAGLIGKVPDLESHHNITIENCGNEATITGVKNVGGILGVVVNNNYAQTTISNCYNTGAINGSSDSGTLCGYADQNFTISNSYNCGTLTGAGASGAFCGHNTSTGTQTVTNCYDVNASQTGVTAMSMFAVESGYLCKLLNSEGNVFSQTVGTDKYPVPGTEGLTGDPDSYWKEVSTAEGFKEAAGMKDVCANYPVRIRLTSDIDLSALSTGDGYMFNTFYGKIDGQNHKLANSSQPLFYSLYGATINNLTLEGFSVSDATSLVARTSGNNTFTNIAMKSCSLKGNDVGANTGLLSGWSSNDYFEYCSGDENCSVSTKHSNVGGIAGYSSGGHYKYCSYRGSVTRTDDSSSNDNGRLGGIVGYALDNTFIEYCFSTASLKCVEWYIGGIAGYAKNSTISHCVNAKDIDVDEYYVGGIVGSKDSSSKVSDCLNFGKVFAAMSAGYIIGGISIASGNNYYYRSAKYQNLSSAGITYSQILNGEYACYATNSDGDTWLYQDIDNNTFGSYFPSPIPAAGKVYRNVICDGTVTYTNKPFQSTAAHESALDGNGCCTVCGTKIVHIGNADELIDFASSVNAGTDYSRAIVYLDNDIDLSDKDFPIIGRFATAPFRGIFDGQGHRIKNMSLNFAEGGIGLFGVVSGISTIKNVIIDSSSAVISTSGSGIAGLVGSTKPYCEKPSIVSIENCGNEANVNGPGNVAGILGALYENDENIANISNCYNTGTIGGGSKSESGSIVGYARLHTSIRNSYNCGIVGGTTDWLTFANTGSDDFDGTIENCYTTVSGDKTPNVTKVSSEDVRLGAVCQKMNANHGTGAAWTQDLENDTYPTFGDAGLHYTRTMDNQWGTICLPFDVEISDDAPYSFHGISAVVGDTLKLYKMTDKLAAGTPALFCMDEASLNEETGKYEIDLSDAGAAVSQTINNPEEVGGITLTGTFNTLADQRYIYYIKDNKFWFAVNPITILQFRAYINGTPESGAYSLILGSRQYDDPDGIDQVENGKLDMENSTIYDLNGRQLQELQQGVNIIKLQNGETKKIVIK